MNIVRHYIAKLSSTELLIHFKLAEQKKKLIKKKHFGDTNWREWRFNVVIGPPIVENGY